VVKTSQLAPDKGVLSFLNLACFPSAIRYHGYRQAKKKVPDTIDAFVFNEPTQPKQNEYFASQRRHFLVANL
jgi:hypothetical protein